MLTNNKHNQNHFIPPTSFKLPFENKGNTVYTFLNNNNAYKA